MTEELNKDFRISLEEAVGVANADAFMAALDTAPSVSIRLNPFKHRDLEKDSVLPLSIDAEPVLWNPHAFMLKERPSFTLDPLFHAGAYYVQDSSAMFVGNLVRKLIQPLERPLRVLDLCAAPGGKTTDLLTSLRSACGNSFVLVSNEVMKQRAAILSDNTGRWGDPCVVVTSVDPAAFASLEGFFDIIVADVPCSGEGMFRKDEQAVRQWSQDNVALCEARQRRIVADVWPALAPDGFMVYSTCTFNTRENDGNVRWIAENLGADHVDLPEEWDGVLKTKYGFSLLPGLVPGEGQYCAVLRKTEGGTARIRQAKTSKDKSFAHLFSTQMDFVQKNDTVLAIPSEIRSEIEVLEKLRPLTKGVAVGTVKGKDLVPHADLALSICLSESAFPSVEVERKTALAFLHKDNIILPDAERGLLLLTYEGCGLGFVKNLGNRTNNLLPQGRRIRMDII